MSLPNMAGPQPLLCRDGFEVTGNEGGYNNLRKAGEKGPKPTIHVDILQSSKKLTRCQSQAKYMLL